MSLSAPTLSSRTDGSHLSGEPDVIVIGAGFGGLGAALRLAERGARVRVLEALNYPGGCASTFTRGGAQHESGATLFSGFGERGLFQRWIDRYQLDVQVDWLDKVVDFRMPGLRLPITRERGDLEARLAALPGAPVEGLRRFFAHQKVVADLLWELLENPQLLPPLGPTQLVQHALRLPRYGPLLADVGRPLTAVLERFGVANFEPLRQFLDGVCQITVQCSAAEAEAPFALGTLDYYWRGTGHVRGGIGKLANGLVEAIRAQGGEVSFGQRVRKLERDGDSWRVHTTRESVRAQRVLANLLPQDLDRILDPAVTRSRKLARIQADVEQGWGACMLYLQLEPENAPPCHLELVADPGQPNVEGNHIFCSISGVDDGPRTQTGLATATVSTHIAMSELRMLSDVERGERVGEIQQRMRETLDMLAPEVSARIVQSLPGSPRTFERFTGRTLGYVGGIPRRFGLRQYWNFTVPEIASGLELIGDSVFPGQSTLAAALGGWKAAERWKAPARAR